MQYLRVTFQNTQTTIDINNLLRCIESLFRFNFRLGFNPIEMEDTQIRSCNILFPSWTGLHKRIDSACWKSVIFGWTWGRGMSNCRIEEEK